MKMFRDEKARVGGLVYPDYDPVQLDQDGGYYFKHISAMTTEGLHYKSDIAVQLGWRDREIDRLKKRVRYLERETEGS